MEVNVKNNVLNLMQAKVLPRQNLSDGKQLYFLGNPGHRDDEYSPVSFKNGYGYYPVPQKVPKVGGKIATLLFGSLLFPPLLIGIPLVLLANPKHVSTKAYTGVKKGMVEVKKISEKLKPKPTHPPQGGIPMGFPAEEAFEYIY